MKKTLLLLLVMLSFTLTYAQEEIVEKEIKDKKETEKKKIKKNSRHFYWGFHFALPPDEEGAELKYGSSYGFEFGYRHKYAITKHYGLGYNVAYVSSLFRMDQNDNKITPNDLIYDKQSLTTHDFRLELFNRFTFKKKKRSRMGTFADLGVYGAWNYNRKHKNVIEEDDSNFIEIHKKLDYVDKWGYGAFVNFGHNRYLLTLKYRLSDFFTEDAEYPGLPAMSLGFQVGLHR